MEKVEKMRGFIVKFLFYSLWIGLIYVSLKYVMPIMMPFFIAFVIAFSLNPLINLVAKKTHINRKAVAIVLLLLVYAVLGTLLTLLGAKIVVSLGGLFRSLPAYYTSSIEPALNNIGNWLDGFISKLDPALLVFFDSASENFSSTLSNVIRSVSTGAVSMLTGIAGRVPWIVVSFFLAIIASFFFVVDYHKIMGFVKRQLSEKTKARGKIVQNFVVNVLLKFARAYLILISITFAEVSIGLFILQVPNAFLIAFITAIVDIVPVLGTGTILIPWAIYSLMMGNYFLGIGLLILYAVITIVRQVIEPRVVGGQIGLYPLLTLVCMFIGARLFGFWGMLGFPVFLTVIIHLNRTGEIKLFKE